MPPKRFPFPAGVTVLPVKFKLEDNIFASLVALGSVVSLPVFVKVFHCNKGTDGTVIFAVKPVGWVKE